jgi:hypothetical protein
MTDYTMRPVCDLCVFVGRNLGGGGIHCGFLGGRGGAVDLGGNWEGGGVEVGRRVI